MIILFLYFIPLFSLSVYSFSLIDPNITFFQTKWWEIFRDKMVYFGYYRREMSWIIYLAIVILLFISHYFFLKRYKQFNPVKLAIIIGTILLFSYPFLSHDFFNYMFDAKVVTVYYKNPYFYKALDFPKDPWLRFMHWTHRTYPYGPLFLLITIIPSFLSFGKFALSFLFFKSTFIIFYILAVFFLNKLNKRYAMIFATNPLIIIEGLVNSHNDLIGVSLGLIGVFYLLSPSRHSDPASTGEESIPPLAGVRSRFARFFGRLRFLRMTRDELITRLIFFLSAGIKYITFPLLFLSRDKKKMNQFIFISIIGALVYLSFKSEIQPWYFLNLFIFLPFYEQLVNRLNIFFFGLLVSYHPYIRLGGWDSLEKINIKHWVIGVFLIINIVYLLFSRKKFSLK
ncbi:hypothetical protein A3A46_03215 [Candidatus Roizmanbacteria bacterium RIFCSPLOWO2_01_FULL_37_13]|uniref:Uncharacterized protein n=1 Tax=Candidatus Roizmanbacteria bacterium RIFCSPHIGHO2_02_FULL_38_11 TaxID=1802039 RepID=A0A1F7GWF9_9BACT|nr:MAG: hypothetical protein A3C25_02050 [Candidatus Roizmanbacteria bacterium RIFCSPHIGHO2_02_FULL_38_11]OGK43141.1 MAG: hypothetical protein A3A46_03215 [Candidatus Roizmanbacteria bacterium RIFCSPLOWO2_01_FULL_37_13]